MNQAELQNLPVGWTWARLGEVAEIGQGGTPSTKKKEYWGGEIPWLRSGEIRFNRISKSKTTITRLGLKESAA
ncbi:restriction endonuclease subunit S, partial [Candidatus Bathyarchaeota archaeon]|nr:restriction endonuclease subunit S [Candidatus Bathyarchaeota archaeon]